MTFDLDPLDPSSVCHELRVGGSKVHTAMACLSQSTFVTVPELGVLASTLKAAWQEVEQTLQGLKTGKIDRTGLIPLKETWLEHHKKIEEVLPKVPAGEDEAILQIALRNCKRLSDLISLYGGAKLPSLNEINIKGLIFGVVEQCHRDYPGICFRFPGPGTETVKAEETLVEQALINLVRNSAQAFERAAQAEPGIADRQIAIECINGEDNKYYIIVSDNGPGISPLIADRLFEKGATTSEGDGHGHGLYANRLQLRDLGGELELMEKPRPGYKTSFRITLPFVRGPG